MRQVTLGRTDIRVGPMAYGCWRLFHNTQASPADKIAVALDCGLNLIDTADIYGYGEPCGFGGAERALGELIGPERGLRSRIVLATKGGITPPRPYNSHFDYLLEALEASLQRLQTDYIDLYQIHRPDLMAPMAETARALDQMVASGKVRCVGVSNFTVAQMRALQANMTAPIVTTQPEFSALHQDPITDGTLDWCSETGATALAWSPLAGGALATGRGDHPRGAAVIDVLDDIAARMDRTRSQIALAFTLHHGAPVIPIIGTQTLARIRESAEAADIALEPRDFYRIIEAYRGEAMP